MNPQIRDDWGLTLGANGLPYALPLHPLLVHLTLGLFIVAVLFDIAGTVFALERPVLKFLQLPTLRSGFYDVGWYNLVAALGVTFFTVAAGFLELLLATPPVDQQSSWGLTAGSIMLLHGVGGVLLLAAIAAMTLWRGLQRYRWRPRQPQQVQWSYLLVGGLMLAVFYLHGTLGAQMGDEFGLHNTAAHLLRLGADPNRVLQP
ncbi:MAG: DUF2231 domain-containing protein [Almyronema sp.]